MSRSSILSVTFQLSASNERFDPAEVYEEFVDAAAIESKPSGDLVITYNVPVRSGFSHPKAEAYRRAKNLVEAHLDFIGVDATYYSTEIVEE